MADEKAAGQLPAPGDVYRTRLELRRTSHRTLVARDARLAHLRLAAFMAAVLIAALGWSGTVSYWLLAVPALAFAILVQRHDVVIRARDRAAHAITFYDRGLARIEDRWLGTGEPGDRFLDDRHLYARDLDIFGRGSLFELLSLARTRAGEETLAMWLTSLPEPAEIRARHDAVAELTSALDLRENMALAGSDLRAAVRTDRLLAWAESPIAPQASFLVVVLLLTGATVVALTHWAVTGGLSLLLGTLVLHGLCRRVVRKQVDLVLHGGHHVTEADVVADVLGHRARDLDAVGGVVRLLEREEFASAKLGALRRLLDTNDVLASRIIGRLHRLSEYHDWERSVHLLPIGLFLLGQIGPALAIGSVLLLWSPHVVLAVERWRSRYGRLVRVWLSTVGEFEALASLAAYRYERPADVFPEIVSTSEHPSIPRGALLEALSIGHPLLPSTEMVRNDVRLADETQLLVVSGSNMSGKSTLLRTVGINAALAFAGAPVRAESLRISPLAIGATLRIQDSLQEGRSRFYAEITRIRELSDVANGPVPLLFLLDELFHGTNSHDRLVGASGVLRSLLDRGAIGLITTHDLALTAVADDLAPRAANVHFEDWFEGDEIRFDYRVKPGPVTRSNAIALMRAVGLAVEEAP